MNSDDRKAFKAKVQDKGLEEACEQDWSSVSDPKFQQLVEAFRKAREELRTYTRFSS